MSDRAMRIEWKIIRRLANEDLVSDTRLRGPVNEAMQYRESESVGYKIFQSSILHHLTMIMKKRRLTAV